MIPGLGFDHRIFQNLELPDCEVVYLDWFDPVPHETLESYAQRMAESIDQNENFALMGHSFGGVLCQEIAQLIDVASMVLISSITERKEIPINLKMIRTLGLHQVISKKVILNSFRFWAEAYGYKTKEEKALFQSMINNISDSYLKWALRELSSWNNRGRSNNTRSIRIHGSHDKTLPISLSTSIDHVVEDGDHFMVFKMAQEISRIIISEFSSQ